MNDKTNFSTTKIDPHLDYIIKHFLLTLSNINIPANQGWVALQPQLLATWKAKGANGWIKDYEKKLRREERSRIKQKMRQQSTGKSFERFPKQKAEELAKEISLLPDNSQKYYLKKFSDLLVDPLYNLHGDAYREKYIELKSDRLCLKYHSSARQAERDYYNSPDNYMQSKAKLSFVLELLLALYDTIAKLVFAESFHRLIISARNGNSDALFSLLQVDRTILECEWVQQHLREAQLSGNAEFFNKIAKAITTSPLENMRIHSTALIVLLSFWNAGLYRLTVKEIAELFEQCGIATQEDTETFRRFIKRLQLAEIEKELEPPTP